MDKTIFVLLDACQYEAASKYLGYLEHMIDYNKGAKYKVLGELPSLSKPMYATLFTGLPVCKHGVTCNEVGGVLPYQTETGCSWMLRAPFSTVCTTGMTTIQIPTSSPRENACAKLSTRILCCITLWRWMNGGT